MGIPGKPSRQSPREPVESNTGTRGRVSTADLTVGDWWHINDLIKPNPDMRRTRLQSCLAHIPGGQDIQIKALALEIGAGNKDLAYYLSNDTTRPGALKLDQRKALAVRVCGDVRCEPWLTDGEWFTPNQPRCAPDWLEALGLEAISREFTYWIAVAHFRMLSTGLSGNPTVIKNVGLGDPWKIRPNWGTRIPLKWDYYLPVLPDMLVNTAKSNVMHRTFITLAGSEGLDPVPLWTRFPESVQAAAKVVPIPDSSKSKDWQRISDGLPSLIMPQALESPLVARVR